MSNLEKYLKAYFPDNEKTDEEDEEEKKDSQEL